MTCDLFRRGWRRGIGLTFAGASQPVPRPTMSPGVLPKMYRTPNNAGHVDSINIASVHGPDFEARISSGLQRHLSVIDPRRQYPGVRLNGDDLRFVPPR